VIFKDANDQAEVTRDFSVKTLGQLQVSPSRYVFGSANRSEQ